MKRLFLLAALAAAILGATPAIAQQGPAGVPGVFGLAESVTAPPPAPQPPRVAPQPTGGIDCATSKQPEQCQARQEARKKAQAACQGSAQRKQCLNEQAQSADCTKASDPARCLRHQKTRKLCAQKLGPEYRQCLRDNLAPKS